MSLRRFSIFNYYKMSNASIFVVRLVVELTLSETSTGVDDKEAPEGDAFVLLDDAPAPPDVHRLVGQDGDAHGAQATLFPGRVGPRQVAEVGVAAAGDDGAVDVLEGKGGIKRTLTRDS
jgi:hypothetical protein